MWAIASPPCSSGQVRLTFGAIFPSCHSRNSVRICAALPSGDRKSVVKGKSVSVRVDLGGGRIIKKKNNFTKQTINISKSKSSIQLINSNCNTKHSNRQLY